MSTPPTDDKPEKLFTFASAGWVLLLAGFFTLVAAAIVLYPVYETGFHRSVGDGHDPKSYGFDLSNLTIDPQTLVGSGFPKDGIHAIVPSLVETATPAEVELIHQNEHLNFLIPTDLVIGLEFDGQTRAYPIRVLNQHEIINDVLGNTPVAVTWSPLSNSAVVFDRLIDGPTTPAIEFGVSGLLIDSTTVLFDRRPGGVGESLWPQLALKAVAGPRVNHPLPLLPFTLTTWKSWTAAHADTRAVLGLRTLKTQYTYEPYSTYLSTDDLKFPVHPLWPHPRPPLKTPIRVTGTLATGWEAQMEKPGAEAATSSAPATSPSTFTIHTFLFAWYALHTNDTDYSAIEKQAGGK